MPHRLMVRPFIGADIFQPCASDCVKIQSDFQGIRGSEARGIHGNAYKLDKRAVIAFPRLHEYRCHLCSVYEGRSKEGKRISLYKV